MVSGSARSTASRSTSGIRCIGDAENVVLDLRLREACDEAVAGAVDVYNLAADMGGMGFIENNKAPVHAVGADQHAHAAGGPRARRRALLLLLVGLRLRGRQADRPGQSGR